MKEAEIKRSVYRTLIHLLALQINRDLDTNQASSRARPSVLSHSEVVCVFAILLWSSNLNPLSVSLTEASLTAARCQ